MQDKNNKILKNGDVIDIHQTVNGQNMFIVLNVNPLDIRYGHDLPRKYEYDKNELLKPDPINGDVSWEIVDNIL